MKDYLNVTIWAYQNIEIKHVSTIKKIHTQLLSALLTSNGLTTQNTAEWLDWIVRENIFKIFFYNLIFLMTQ